MLEPLLAQWPPFALVSLGCGRWQVRRRRATTHAATPPRCPSLGWPTPECCAMRHRTLPAVGSNGHSTPVAGLHHSYKICSPPCRQGTLPARTSTRPARRVRSQRSGSRDWAAAYADAGKHRPVASSALLLTNFLPHLGNRATV